MILLQLLIVIIPIVVAVLLGILVIWPDLIFVITAMNVLVIFYGIWQISRNSKVDKRWYNYVALPIIFHISTLLFLVLVSGWKLIALMFCLNIVFLYLYLRTLYYFLIKPTAYQEYSLEHISLLGALLTFFLLAVSGFGFILFLEISVWSVIVGFVFLNFIIYYQVLLLNLIEIKKIILFSLFISITLTEIAWSISFLPLKYYISGFCLAIFDYMLLALTRFYLLNRLNRKIIKVYLGLSIGCLIIVLLTARWI